MDLILPFKIGDFAESKCFVEGFKGAWFRSKIKDMRVSESGHLEYYLEYIDYTDEDNEWIGVFQKNPLNPASGERKSSDESELMVRPSFPQWYREKQVPEHFSQNELIAIVSDAWKVGDQVDWQCGDCFWNVEIIKLVSKDVVQVKLLDPPMGEGGQHPAKKKHLRPALDWSIIKGWTVPLSAAKGKSWQAARLVHPISDIEESNTDDEEALGSSTIKHNQRDTILMSTEKARKTHQSPDLSRWSIRSSSRRQISPSGPVQLQPPATMEGAMAEPNGPSSANGSRRYPFRARRNAAAQQ